MTKHTDKICHAWNWGLAIDLFTLQNQQKLPTDNDLHQRLVISVISYQLSVISTSGLSRRLEDAECSSLG